jgi:hypothetical protein
METYEVLQDVMSYIGDCIDDEKEMDMMELYQWLEAIMLRAHSDSILKTCEAPV